jgi:uncharacterized protein
MNTHRNPVGWFEIYVSDMARARSFYEATLSLKLELLPSPSEAGEPTMEMWTFPGSTDHVAPGCSGALVKMDGVTPGPGGTLNYFSCQDCAVEAARAAASGGHVVKEKMSIGPYGYIALVIDTEGNMIGLHSMA